MATQPSTSSHAPSSLVDALWALFTTTYGTSKVRAMWEGARHDLVSDVWSRALSPYRREAIERAALALADRRDADGARSGWPPTLPEFIDLVEAEHRDLLRAERLANERLAAPTRRVISDEQAAANRERIRENLAFLRSRGIVRSDRAH